MLPYQSTSLNHLPSVGSTHTRCTYAVAAAEAAISVATSSKQFLISLPFRLATESESKLPATASYVASCMYIFIGSRMLRGVYFQISALFQIIAGIVSQQTCSFARWYAEQMLAGKHEKVGQSNCSITEAGVGGVAASESCRFAIAFVRQLAGSQLPCDTDLTRLDSTRLHSTRWEILQNW